MNRKKDNKPVNAPLPVLIHVLYKRQLVSISNKILNIVILLVYVDTNHMYKYFGKCILFLIKPLSLTIILPNFASNDQTVSKGKLIDFRSSAQRRRKSEIVQKTFLTSFVKRSQTWSVSGRKISQKSYDLRPFVKRGPGPCLGA
jgi:hypothetical protein